MTEVRDCSECNIAWLYKDAQVLGKEKYIGCVACHGAGGEGGVGPALNNQSAVEIADKLIRYKNGETIGGQSSLMWSQASMLSNDDIDNLAAYIESL